MNIVSSFKERAPKIAISIALLLAVIAPAVVVTHVFAAQATERSIALSSSSAGATGVTYDVSFTTPSNASGGFVIDFCKNTPDPTVTCEAPTGFTAASVTTNDSGYAVAQGTGANQVVVTTEITNGTPVSVKLNGLQNPAAAGALYARVATFNAGSQSTVIDQGSVAISITNTIGVSGSVLESLTFCVANKTITANCGDASDNLPTLKLGEKVGDVTALSPSAISTGVLYTQISTNAATGAVVNLRSATECGGLTRAGVATCDITPALTDGVSEGQAKFGLKTGTASGTAGYTGASGTIQAAGAYNDTTYTYNYRADKASGVTSAIGDPILNTDSKPANNQNMPITFGVSVSNSTPAGNYSTSLTMIATGKF